MIEYTSEITDAGSVFTVKDMERNCSVSFTLKAPPVTGEAKAKFEDNIQRNLDHCLVVHLHSVIDNANNTTP